MKADDRIMLKLKNIYDVMFVKNEATPKLPIYKPSFENIFPVFLQDFFSSWSFDTTLDTLALELSCKRCGI